MLDQETIEIDSWIQSKQHKKLPVVFSTEESRRVFAHLEHLPLLAALLMYGAGLRLMETLRLRVKDIDFDRMEITVREGKGSKERKTLLPKKSILLLHRTIERANYLHNEALNCDIHFVHLIGALARKYPNAAKELAWQYLFSSKQLSKDPRTGQTGRHNISERHIQKSVKTAIKKAGIHKHASCHTFTRSFATHLLENGYDIRTVQELLGHDNVNNTMMYTHVLNKGGKGVNSPVDI